MKCKTCGQKIPLKYKVGDEVLVRAVIETVDYDDRDDLPYAISIRNPEDNSVEGWVSQENVLEKLDPDEYVPDSNSD